MNNQTNSDNNLAVEIAGVKFKNPILTASGTFSSGKEFSQFADISVLGGITAKGVSFEPWTGNPPPRIAETYGGMLNSVGLQNPGAKAFIENDIPFLDKLDTNVIVNICGHSTEEYLKVTEALNEQPIDLYELNISCPNIKEGGIGFGTNCKSAYDVVKAVKAVSKKPLVVKLTPNVTDITEIALAVEAAGADAISMINTLLGMKIDIYKKKPVLANKVGGLSGPAILPVAVRMVYQVAQKVKIPIIGMGGVMTGSDAIELMMAGATAVAIGTANFTNPTIYINVINEINEFMSKQGIKNINEIIGVIK